MSQATIITIINFVAIVTLLFTSAVGDHMIMRPMDDEVADGLSEAALLLLPETGTRPSDYQMLGIMLQNACRLRLWIAVLDVSQEEALTLDDLPVVLYGANRDLTQQGMDRDASIFLGAHGHIGHVAGVYAQVMPGDLSGLLLMGTFLQSDIRLTDFPVRVMTLVGDLDGVTRITRIATTVQTMEKEWRTDPDLVMRCPLVVMEGSNHAVFTGGDLPLPLHQLDIEPEVNALEAVQKASALVAHFLTSSMDPSGQAEARLAFEKAFQHAQTLTQPIRSVRNLTQENMKSYWVKSAQKWLSGLQGSESTLIEVDSFVTAPTSLEPLPPTLGMDGGIYYIITFSEVLRAVGSTDARAPDGGTSHQATLEIAARMIGPERIQKHLGSTNITRNYTCRDLNYASFLTAYHSASPAARARFDQAHTGAHFSPDVTSGSVDAWTSTPLKFTISGRRLKVTAASYRTGNDVHPRQEAGLYFCKLLPPDRALEWIYVDSLRRGK